ncbi:caspase family protein [Bacteroidota bacterium]
MKTIGLVLILIGVNFSLFSQNKPVIVSRPNLEISDLKLKDQNGNLIIEANEYSEIVFQLVNSGDGQAKFVRIKLSQLNPVISGIEYKKSISLNSVAPKSTQKIRFPITPGTIVTEGVAEFKVEVIEQKGFDAFPLTIMIKTAQGDIPLRSVVEGFFPDEINTVLKPNNIVFSDQSNGNNTIDHNETNHINLQLFNVGENIVESAIVHAQLINDSITGINVPYRTWVGKLDPGMMRVIAIPVKSTKEVKTGIADFAIFFSDESGLRSETYEISVATKSLEFPKLRISDVEYTGSNNGATQLNQPINIKITIANSGKGSANDVDLLLSLVNENVEFVGRNSKGRIEEIPAGKSKEISFQIIANRRFFLDKIPVKLAVSEDLSSFSRDTFIMVPIAERERKDIVIASNQIAEVNEQKTIQEKKPTKTVKLKVLPNIELIDQKFIDSDNNNIINANEDCSISIRIKNSGNGIAKDIQVNTAQLNTSIPDLAYPQQIALGSLNPNQETMVSIPINGNNDLQTGISEFKINVREAQGFDAIPLIMKIKTQERLLPDISIHQFHFNDETGQLRLNYPIELKVNIKNAGLGVAEDIRITFVLPDENCILLGESDEFSISEMESGESKELNLLFTATRRYNSKDIPIKINITESISECSIDTTVVAVIGSEVLAVNEFEVKPDEIIVEPEKTTNEFRGSGDPLKGLNYNEALKEMEIGRYFTLVIGIDNYSGVWSPLKNAVHDAQAVEEILKSNYKFDHFRTLYNDMATRENIIRELEWFVRNVTSDDNLLIYFSGHGEYKEVLNKGYWVPVDAKTVSTFDYISNSDIQTFLSSINSKHTLLISDACFSGDIFRGYTVSIPFESSERYFRNVHDKSSRHALTSGGIEPVMDGGKEGHSVFTYYLIKSLRENQDKFFDASQLFNQVRIPVINNSEQSPEFQPIKNTGDEGGQFIFIKNE